jgi:hypothetical protein
MRLDTIAIGRPSTAAETAGAGALPDARDVTEENLQARVAVCC